MESIMIFVFFVFILGICIVVKDAVNHANKSASDHKS